MQTSIITGDSDDTLRGCRNKYVSKAEQTVCPSAASMRAIRFWISGYQIPIPEDLCYNKIILCATSIKNQLNFTQKTPQTLESSKSKSEIATVAETMGQFVPKMITIILLIWLFWLIHLLGRAVNW